MKPQTKLSSACLVAMLAFASSEGTQASAPQGAQPLPWGPPVPRSVHSAAEALRMRALNHCMRTRSAKGMAMDLADADCRRGLLRGSLE